MSSPAATEDRQARRDALRFHLEVRLESADEALLPLDVRQGLWRPQKTLPSKYFYDDYGCLLFERISAQPEYYLTRREEDLLMRVADEVVGHTVPDDLVDLGSGSSRKARVVLDALRRSEARVRYVPVDVNEAALWRTSSALLADYPEIWVHAMAGDFERHLGFLPEARRRLVMFLGSTVGNFSAAEAVRFLRRLAGQLNEDDYLLLGVDLLKDEPVLEAAYNDAAGVTAEFNRNILTVVNRGVGGGFDLDDFEHRAFFHPKRLQVEMHLVARRTHVVDLTAFNTSVAFAAGETILTEICRKFTHTATEAMLWHAGFEQTKWFETHDGYFGLSLARRR